jgi:hypothetical protein
MYIDWESYAVMGIKTMKSFSRPRGEYDHTPYVSIVFFKRPAIMFQG